MKQIAEGLIISTCVFRPTTQLQSSTYLKQSLVEQWSSAKRVDLDKQVLCTLGMTVTVEVEYPF
jgi:hypothetical protein